MPGWVDDEETPKDKAPRPASKFEPEYRHLLNVITVIVRNGVPSSVVDKVLADHTIKSTTDLEAIASQLWTIASEEYGIPRAFLTKEVEKLKKKEE